MISLMITSPNGHKTYSQVSMIILNEDGSLSFTTKDSGEWENIVLPVGTVEILSAFVEKKERVTV